MRLLDNSIYEQFNENGGFRTFFSEGSAIFISFF